jgi:AcrR family transcriptional regulator
VTDADTKTRILDAAENLFATKGFQSTSLRSITGGARVNLAAVHYHFGSREALIRAVMARRVDPLNQERIALLDACEAAAPGSPPPLEEILRAFLRPSLRLLQSPDRGDALIRQLVGRVIISSDEQMESLLIEHFGEVGKRFMAALQRSLPHLDHPDLAWRFLFTIGSMALTMTDHNKLKFISGGTADPADTETALEQLVAFLAAGFRADAPRLAIPSGGSRS